MSTEMKQCFECKSRHMFLVRCWYEDLYEHYGGEAKERLICLACLLRRADLRMALRDKVSQEANDVIT